MEIILLKNILKNKVNFVSYFNLYKFFLVCFYVFIPFAVFAEDICSKYKFDVDVNVQNKTVYNPVIKMSEENMVGKMGETLYQTSYASKILLINIPVKNGFCVSLRSVDIDINVPEFTIILDKRLKKYKCAYDIVLSHEQDHVNVNKSVINNNIDNIKKAVLSAVSAINPVFITDIKDAEKIQKEIQEKIESFKDVKDIQQKIKTEMDKNNEDIDTRGDSFNVWKCEDFYKEMKKFSDTITID